MTSKEFNARMGKVIRELRLKNGLTQEAIGSKINVTFQQVQKYERGVNGIAACYLPKLAELLGVTVADFYERIGTPRQSVERSPAENDSFLAARYVGKIEDPKIRSVIIDVARKAAYQGEAA
jgi:transcriptional regulator with XRE-family HTH domain